jgi:RHS repeat-associated protein
LYNGKELQTDFDLNWLDYGARYYDPAIARWGQVDPMAESYYSTSSYAYVLNNPIGLIDPNGMFAAPPSTHKDKEGNVIAKYDDGDNNTYIHNDIGGNGQHIDGMKSLVDQKRELTESTGGGGKIEGSEQLHGWNLEIGASLIKGYGIEVGVVGDEKDNVAPYISVKELSGIGITIPSFGVQFLTSNEGKTLFPDSPQGDGGEATISAGPIAFTYGSDDTSPSPSVTTFGGNDVKYSMKGFSIGRGSPLGLTFGGTKTIFGSTVNVKNNPHLKLIRLRMGGL